MLSAIAGLVVATGAYVVSLLLGAPMSAEAILAVFIVASAVAAAALRYAVILVARQVARIVEELEAQQLGDELDLEDLGEEELSYAWMLADRVAKAAAPGARSTRLAVDHGDYIYALDDLPEEVARAAGAEGRPRAALAPDSTLHIIVPPATARALARAAAAGEGEAAVVEDETTMVALYEIAKNAHKAYYGSNDEIAAYAAYKALRRLAREGAVEAPQHLLSILPFEAHDLRERILAQVREEED